MDSFITHMHVSKKANMHYTTLTHTQDHLNQMVTRLQPQPPLALSPSPLPTHLQFLTQQQQQQSQRCAEAASASSSNPPSPTRPHTPAPNFDPVPPIAVGGMLVRSLLCHTLAGVLRVLRD